MVVESVHHYIGLVVSKRTGSRVSEVIFKTLNFLLAGHIA